jgi:hypothetical protein
MIDYITNPRLKDAQINLLKQANVVNALQIIGLTLNHSDLVSVTIEEADALAQRMGISLIPDDPI